MLIIQRINIMADLKIIKISDLGQSDINDNNDVIYLIDKDACLNIKASSNIKILDTLSNGNVKLNVEKDAFVSYTILNSKNTKRVFDIYGSLELSEISLDETEENINANLMVNEARFDSKCLSFASNIESSFHVNVIHKAKETFSNVSNIGVALNGGKLLFDVVGKIEKGMMKSKCAQLSRGIVMDNESKVDAKPVLLIDEYDCFANHGASIGKVSDEDLFYLMSRGLSKNEAFILILEGIIRPFIDGVYIEEYKKEIEEKVAKLI